VATQAPFVLSRDHFPFHTDRFLRLHCLAKAKSELQAKHRGRLAEIGGRQTHHQRRDLRPTRNEAPEACPLRIRFIVVQGVHIPAEGGKSSDLRAGQRHLTRESFPHPDVVRPLGLVGLVCQLLAAFPRVNTTLCTVSRQ